MPEQSSPRTLQSLGAPLDASQIPYDGPGDEPCPPPQEYGVPIRPQALVTAACACDAAPEDRTPQVAAEAGGVLLVAARMPAASARTAARRRAVAVKRARASM